jgi:hypothetical protein
LHLEDDSDPKNTLALFRPGFGRQGKSRAIADRLHPGFLQLPFDHEFWLGMVTVAEKAILADFLGVVAREAGFFADGLEIAGQRGPGFQEPPNTTCPISTTSQLDARANSGDKYSVAVANIV